MSYRHSYREPYAVDSRSALYSREQRNDQDNYARRHEDSRGRPRGGTLWGKNSSRGSYHPEHRNRGRGGYGRGSHADRITRYRREDHYRATDSLAHPPSVQPPKHQSDRPETPLLIAKSPSQPVVSSPPNPNALDSLDKLLQFKANADATRRQTDFEPGQLALVAQSFLKAKSKSTSSPASSVETPEPGEVIEPPLEDAQSRAAILKASLLKKRKNEHSHVQVKTELAGEDSHNPATDRSSPKRARLEHGRAAATKTHEHSREYVSDHRPSVGNFVPSRYRTFPRRDDQGRSPSEQRRGSGHADNLLRWVSSSHALKSVASRRGQARKMLDTHLTVHFATPAIAFPLRVVTIGKNRRMAEAQVGTVHTDMAISQNHAMSKCHPEQHLTLQSSSFPAQGGVHSTPRSRACPRTQSRGV